MAREAPRLRRGDALRSSHHAGGVTSRECADPRASRTDGYRDSVQKGTVIVHGRENDKDSCDEFPFAATNQSGASQLKAKKEKGTVCAQLQSVRTAKSGTEAEQWGNVAVIGTPNYSVPCVRGHVTLKLNNSTGGSYRAFIQSQRLFVDDAFWVSVGT